MWCVRRRIAQLRHSAAQRMGRSARWLCHRLAPSFRSAAEESLDEVRRPRRRRGQWSAPSTPLGQSSGMHMRGRGACPRTPLGDQMDPFSAPPRVSVDARCNSARSFRTRVADAGERAPCGGRSGHQRRRRCGGRGDGEPVRSWQGSWRRADHQRSPPLRRASISGQSAFHLQLPRASVPPVARLAGGRYTQSQLLQLMFT
jgi:hypothetical protein